MGLWKEILVGSWVIDGAGGSRSGDERVRRVCMRRMVGRGKKAFGMLMVWKGDGIVARVGIVGGIMPFRTCACVTVDYRVCWRHISTIADVAEGFDSVLSGCTYLHAIPVIQGTIRMTSEFRPSFRLGTGALEKTSRSQNPSVR